ncbi:ABC transporter ATP-binding protein, partial [Myxococcota bacterium]|nr:ABC transporter ATP-binding protein [Myxococcota bacterium]
LPMRKYSKGMLQRAGLAQALINDPDLVIMDEPLSGLDPIGRRELREIILALKKRGKTVLFSSHILSDVEEICDRVAIVARGKVREIGTIDSLLNMGISGAELEVKGDEEAILTLAGELGLSTTRSMTGYRVGLPSNTRIQEILGRFMEAGIQILELKRHRHSLESIFVERSEKAQEEA